MYIPDFVLVDVWISLSTVEVVGTVGFCIVETGSGGSIIA
jgi:hypothetical protein